MSSCFLCFSCGKCVIRCRLCHVAINSGEGTIDGVCESCIVKNKYGVTKEPKQIITDSFGWFVCPNGCDSDLIEKYQEKCENCTQVFSWKGVMP